MVHLGSTLSGMSTPAVSEAIPSAPIAAPHPPPAPVVAARAGPVRHGRAASAPRLGRPALPTPNPAWEIVAGVLLLVAWAMLWSFFLTRVVEPGSELRRDAGKRAAVTARWADP
jgi:hypothetical protein